MKSQSYWTRVTIYTDKKGVRKAWDPHYQVGGLCKDIIQERWCPWSTKRTCDRTCSYVSFFSSQIVIWRFSWWPVPLGVAGLKLSPNQLTWKTLVKLFADKGYVLWNYPEGVAFPCDDIKGKGIQGVPVKEQTILLEAFTHPMHPIKLVQTYKSGGV